VGSNAVQGARFAGARRVVVVDPVEFKRDMALSTFGATHAFATAEEAFEFVREDTWGELADRAIITVGILHDKVIADAINVIGKTGQVTITAVGGGHFDTNSGILLGYGRKIQGSIYGGCSPLVDVPALIRLYEAGDLKLEELITRRYKLDEINQGYQDMLDGKNVRGVIVHEH
jgi:S-(hydroxymethyl)glutathione dehydrogenase/alcohol dehydrogenase